MSDCDHDICREMPIRLRPEYRWFWIKNDILDAYARAMFNLDIPIWDIRDVKEQSLAYPEFQKKERKMEREWTCHFCGEVKKLDEDGLPYKQFPEMGEFWSEKLQDSVMAHVDCLPEGVLEGTNDEWSMA